MRCGQVLTHCLHMRGRGLDTTHFKLEKNVKDVSFIGIVRVEERRVKVLE